MNDYINTAPEIISEFLIEQKIFTFLMKDHNTEIFAAIADAGKCANWRTVNNENRRVTRRDIRYKSIFYRSWIRNVRQSGDKFYRACRAINKTNANTHLRS